MSLATYDVPVDIIELIIDQASLQDDNQFSTLRACALAGRDFVRPSQRRIFHSIKFKGQHVYGHGDPLDKYLRMQDILISTPELALYVRKFVLKDKTMGLRLVTQPLFPMLLGKLERLTTFVLGFQRYTSGTGDWDQFSPALKQALVDTCQLSSIGQLTFKYIKNLPPHCVTYSPNVELVSVRFADQANDQQLSTESTVTPRGHCVETLAISDQRLPTTRSLIDFLSFQKCKVKILVINSYDWCTTEVARELMRIAGASLTTLSFNDHCEVVPERALGLSEGILTGGQIRTLKLYLNFKKIQMSSIERVLYNTRADNTIREICLEIVLKDFADVTYSRRSDWQKLDTLLTGPLFSQLRSVKFTCKVTIRLTKSQHQYMGMLLRTHLSELFERKMIRG